MNVEVSVSDDSMRSDALKAKIIKRIQTAGPVTFFEYMHSCLYDTEYGYYTVSPTVLGPGGDFITAPEIHDIFAETIADHAAQVWQRLGDPSSLDFLEFGAGSGKMAAAIHDRWRKTGAGAKMRYGIIEISPVLRAAQQKLLVNSPDVFWLDALADIGTVNAGYLLANEFIDALPVHIVIKDGQELKEIYVDHDADIIFESFGPLSTPQLEGYLYANKIELWDGQRIEINLEADAWLSECASRLQKGVVAIIDYGYAGAEMHSLKHYSGTLMCYRSNRFSSDPYRTPGAQDITSHVDFSALGRKAIETGFDIERSSTLAEFLIEGGILTRLEDPDISEIERVRATQAVKMMIMPAGMGRIFRVLVLSKSL